MIFKSIRIIFVYFFSEKKFMTGQEKKQTTGLTQVTVTDVVSVVL